MIRGSCLCGQVRFELDGAPQFINHCHCSMCRKVHGAAFGSFLHADGNGFRWLVGESRVTNYPSSPGQRAGVLFGLWLERSRARRRRQARDHPRGLLDDDPIVRPVVHIHTASRAPWFADHRCLASVRRVPARRVLGRLRIAVDTVAHNVCTGTTQNTPLRVPSTLPQWTPAACSESSSRGPHWRWFRPRPSARCTSMDDENWC